MAEGEDKKECPKKECDKEECPDFKGFHGFGPRCHGKMGFPPMWGMLLVTLQCGECLLVTKNVNVNAVK